MMTDLERFIELYRSFGIECVVNTDSDGTAIIWFTGDNDLFYRKATYVEGGQDSVGYTVSFDSTGRFAEHRLNSCFYVD